MDQRTLTEALILDSIANDYEDFAMISQEVRDWAQERGFLPEVSEIWAILMGFLEKGLAKAYRLAGAGPAEYLQLPTQQDEDCYFYLTRAGRESLRAY